MKKVNLSLVIMFFLVFCSFPQLTKAQDRKKDESEREIEILKDINSQKKSMYEEQRKLDEMNRILKDRQIEIENILENMDKEGLDSIVRRSKKIIIDKGALPFNGRFNYPGRPGMDPFAFSFVDNDGEKTSWNLSKSIKESTFSKEYEMNVEESARKISMSVMGDCKSGVIKVGIYMPGGRKYSDIILDESGNLNWRKSFDISEKDNRDKTGDWKFKIDASKATGYFRISLETF
jgi:NAD-specific glutamate dehydrogenase